VQPLFDRGRNRSASSGTTEVWGAPVSRSAAARAMVEIPLDSPDYQYSSTLYGRLMPLTLFAPALATLERD
jgi:hypothetical protein